MLGDTPACSKLIELAPDARLSGRRATLTYRAPAQLADQVAVGHIVWAPLRDKLVLGVVMAVRPDHGEPALRSIHSLVEPAVRLSATQLALAGWIAEQVVCSVFEAAALMLPPGAASSMVEHLRLTSAPQPVARDDLTPLRRKLYDLLVERGELPLATAQRELGSSLTTVVDQLAQAGVIERVARVRPISEARPADVRVVHLEQGAVAPERAPVLGDAFERVALRLRARPDACMPIVELVTVAKVTRPQLQSLAERGLLRIEQPAGMPSQQPDAPSRLVQLTREQAGVWNGLRELAERGSPGKVLLQGVTGSGKTELYFRAAAHALARGKSAIILAPEIALAGQLIQRARERFGEQALVLHSELPDRRRLLAWRRAADGEPLLVIGPRSALFAPLPHIGLIVLDEEHDPAFKQDRPPRYHARAVAARLAELHGALLVLGSATPDVETVYRAGGAGWEHMHLTERVGQRVLQADGRYEGVPIDLPEVTVIDMRAELRGRGQALLSTRLLEAVASRLSAGEQTLLFLNRRGSSTFVQCRSCGEVSQCPHCEVPLVYHRAGDRLMCHRCGSRYPVPDRCAACGSAAIGYYGAGTQRVESEIAEAFPSARILRWDRDSVRRGGQERMLEQVQSAAIDIVVGTQMIAKGLDLPAVTLVGIVNADGMLYLPDFRAAERTFQLLAQVSGRAGRRTSGGEVILQTFTPDHYAIRFAARHDFEGFYAEELAFRRRLGYPPFKRLARLTYRHTDFAKAGEEAERLAGILEQWMIERPLYNGIDIIGPSPAFAGKIRDRYVWQLMLRGDLLSQLLGDISPPPGWTIDVDPVNLL